MKTTSLQKLFFVFNNGGCRGGKCRFMAEMKTQNGWHKNRRRMGSQTDSKRMLRGYQKDFKRKAEEQIYPFAILLPSLCQRSAIRLLSVCYPFAFLSFCYPFWVFDSDYQMSVRLENIMTFLPFFFQWT